MSSRRRAGRPRAARRSSSSTSGTSRGRSSHRCSRASPTTSPSRSREAVAARAAALDARITAASPDWPADRLGTLERNILRIGVYELEEETVPREVAINEAVVLAKRYATEDAARLVNGILGRVAREQEAA